MIPNEYIVLCAGCKRILDIRYATKFLGKAFHTSCIQGFKDALAKKIF